MAKKVICAHCGTRNKVKRNNKGSLLIEFLLWVLMLAIGPFTGWLSLIAAVVYSVWRLFNFDLTCGSCGKDELVDVTTPRGKKLLDEYS